MSLFLDIAGAVVAGITISGMASGLPPNIVDQLMEAEKIPVKQIEARKAKSENRLKLVNEAETKLAAMKDSLKELAGTRSFNDIQVNSGDPNVINGTADPATSKTGSWNIEVVELPQKAAALTNGFPDKDKTKLGVGYFRFETPDGDKDVFIDGDNNTLEKAASKINAANLGVRASVIRDGEDADNPYRLLLAGEGVGNENKVTYPKLYFLDGDQDLYFSGEKEAKNGKIKVDGFEIQVFDTKIADIIPGVTLDLRQASPGRSINIGVSENREAVSGKIKSFVDATNAVLSFIQAQNNLDQKTDTSQTLGGDTILRSIESRLRRVLIDPQMGIQGPIKRLSQLGIEFSRQGTLNFSQEKFNKALAENPDGVRQFFVGDNFSVGLMPSIRREISFMLDSNNGVIGNKKKGLKDQISQMDQRIDMKERHLQKKESQLREKFARLEETVSRMKQQGAALGGMAQAAG